MSQMSESGRISAPFTLEERHALSHRQSSDPFLCPDRNVTYHAENLFRPKGALAVTADGLVCRDCGYLLRTLVLTTQNAPAAGAGA